MPGAAPQLLREHPYVESSVVADAQFLQPAATISAGRQSSVYVDVVPRLTACEDRADLVRDASRGKAPLSFAACCSTRKYRAKVGVRLSYSTIRPAASYADTAAEAAQSKFSGSGSSVKKSTSSEGRTTMLCICTAYPPAGAKP